MNKNWLKYFGFLGLLGLLGVFTSNVGYYGFFGFFGFFGFSKIIADERFSANLNKAARNAFLVAILLYVIATIYANLIHSIMVYAYCFAIGFALQTLVFSFSLQYYDRVGE